MTEEAKITDLQRRQIITSYTSSRIGELPFFKRTARNSREVDLHKMRTYLTWTNRVCGWEGTEADLLLPGTYLSDCLEILESEGVHKNVYQYMDPLQRSITASPVPEQSPPAHIGKALEQMKYPDKVEEEPPEEPEEDPVPVPYVEQSSQAGGPERFPRGLRIVDKVEWIDKEDSDETEEGKTEDNPVLLATPIPIISVIKQTGGGFISRIKDYLTSNE